MSLNEDSGRTPQEILERVESSHFVRGKLKKQTTQNVNANPPRRARAD